MNLQKINNASISQESHGIQGKAREFSLKTMEKINEAIDCIDWWTSPHESTGGNFENASYFQAGSNAASIGFALGGVKGAVGSIAASTLGIFVENKTHSTSLGVLAGMICNALIGGAMGSGAGPAGIVTGIITGGLVGAFQVFRGNASDSVRSSAGNTGLLTGPFISGPAKVGAGIGSAIGVKLGKSNIARAAIGASVAIAIGAGLCALGISPAGIGTVVVVNGIGGAIGPFFGPRFTQLFRNLSNAIGKKLSSKAEQHNLIRMPLKEREKNIIGSIPASYIKEGLRSFILSDGSLTAIIFSGIVESIKQIDVFLHAKKEPV